MNDIKIKVKKSELEYCFKADNYDEFHRRFNQLADIMYQRFINELTIEQLKKALVNNIYGYIDTDMAYAERKQKISSVYGVSCKDNTTKTKINKRFGNWVQIGEQSAKCTECGGVFKSNGIDKTGKALIFNAVYHYCPNCGSRMDGDDENES